jgi:hypothetical protein
MQVFDNQDQRVLMQAETIALHFPGGGGSATYVALSFHGSIVLPELMRNMADLRNNFSIKSTTRTDADRVGITLLYKTNHCSALSRWLGGNFLAIL